ncbi:Ca-activated chloride channel family protein [Yoonia tamlensis]|uniref:Ca-activated chloride channel family protein n=2 Tax=Yoonia tamlensis TaxID=390270 RepID=A0A1I6G515_9RHOB|nr:Ca-activated chloride channel family protein [Yoonia tamlensis]
MYRLIPFVVTATIATAATAQDAPNTILVLDGSGSMWGQIDGVAKITIAQEVVAELLSDFPADQGLGLTVYGHRERGNCTDIETIVAPAPGTAASIVDAVNAIKPLGKTPMTDAVIAAAEALRYTEDSATVILVSDGVETCNPDPCAAARLLEEAGINFTAHVVGFDVDDPEAIAQMQCLAEETGGKFLTAANAAELDLAMTQMVSAPAPEPEPALVPVTFTAIEGADGPVIGDPVLWSITGADVSDIAGNPYEMELPEGSYVATAYRVSTETALDAQFIAIGDGAEVVITFPVPEVQAKIIGPDEAPLGATIQVGWDGPDGDRDYLAVGKVGETGYANYTYTADGNPLALQMPPETGSYELRYVTSDGETIATAPITITPVEITLDAADEAAISEQLSVTWTGPDYARDFIAVGVPGENAYINYTYTEEGGTLDLQMPTEPGAYEIRYVLGQGSTTLMTRPITVTDTKVTLIAPQTAEISDEVMIGWDGPGFDRDFISVGEVGESGYINYTYVDDGNPLALQMPAEPGTYEIRYQLAQGSEILAQTTIEITAPEISVNAPSEAIAGSTVTVDWVGPDHDRDYIAVAETGASNYVNYAHTNNGNPLELLMPVEPGDYEIRYVLAQGSTVVASQPITITAVKAGITGPANANIGDTITIEWTGPDYARDFIGVGPVGETRYLNYTSTEAGSPLGIEMPTEPGTYELRYHLGQGSAIIYRQQITVDAITAELVAEDSVVAGTEFVVGWDGPDYPRDYIGISVPGDSAYEDYAYTESGNPVSLTAPDIAGDYELRYFINQERTIIGTRMITVTK